VQLIPRIMYALCNILFHKIIKTHPKKQNLAYVSDFSYYLNRLSRNGCIIKIGAKLLFLVYALSF
jgi:hypothetical protein